MGKPCKAILIDPFACTVTEVDYSGDYRDIYKLLSHESMPVRNFEAAYPEFLKEGDTVYVDEEGLLKPCARFILAHGHGQPFAGKALVFGTDEDGESVSPKTDLETIRRAFVFLAHHGDEPVIDESTPTFTQTSAPWTPPKDPKKRLH